jgi:carbon monoxide dehydrogenase subunit G
MEMTGDYVIAAPRATVWAALNDIEVLKAAIPGCEAIARTSADQIEATVTAKVGPVKASFQGVVTLSDLDPPNGYTIRGEGKGGAAGFARGGAKVSLTDAPGGTRLAYVVDAAVGGKLAQIGSRLIDATAKKLADEFFAAFSAKVTGTPAVVSAPVAEAPPAVLPPAPTPVHVAAKPHHDALAAFKPIGFLSWVAMLVILAGAVAVVTLVF